MLHLTATDAIRQIIKNDFPVPRIPPPEPPPPPLFGDALSKPDEVPSSQSSTATNKENAPPARPPVPPFSVSTSQATIEASQADTEAPSIPQSLLELYSAIRDTLNKSFSKFPPHTIQRLAELIVSPKQHYQFLPSYLRALDRVVCVSSSADIFPLPQAGLPGGTPGTLLNGVGSGASTPSLTSLGSDESLGGALLTPIPWLKPERAVEERVSPTQAQALNSLHGQQSGNSNGGNELKSEETEMVDGPNGVGRIETVSVVNGVLVTQSTGNGSSPQTSPTRARPAEGAGAAASVEESLREAGAVTQGELIRLEQEAGVVPVSVASRSPQRARMSTGATDVEGSPLSDSEMVDDGEGDDEGKDEAPHARGPEEIGAEDVGPGQERLGSPGVLDMERAVGRNLHHGEQSTPKDAEMQDNQAGSSDVDMAETESKADSSKAEPETELEQSKDETK